MNVVFMGASSFGLQCLKAISTINNIYVTGIIGSSKFFKISYSESRVNNVLHADLSHYASSRAIDYFHFNSEIGMKDISIHAFLERKKPDVIIVVGWYHLIPKLLLSSFNFYGLHSSLLPKYSGGAPLVWAMLNGESQTGITLFKFSPGVDDGPIVGQSKVPILPSDTIKSLQDRVSFAGIDLLVKYVPLLLNADLPLVFQDEAERTIFPQRSPHDGLIDWSMHISYIDRFIRSQTHPYPGAFTYIYGIKVTIWKSRVLSGTWCCDPNSFSVLLDSEVQSVSLKCSSGLIVLLEVSISDATCLSGSSIYNYFSEHSKSMLSAH